MADEPLDSVPMWRAMLNSLLHPLHLAILFFAMFVPLGIFWWRRKNGKKAQSLVPIETFLTELSRGASPGHDKKLFSMFPPDLFQKVDKGLIRAMSRCLVAECGYFVELDRSTLSSRKVMAGENKVTMVNVAANFTRKKNVKCVIAWMVEKKRAFIVSFEVKPDEPLDVMSHIDPKDFEQLGERFVSSLFMKSPKFALQTMCEPLRKKYEDETALTSEVMKILRLTGGLKNKTEVDITLTGASLSEEKKHRRVELEYVIVGELRDMKATVRLHFSSLKAEVIRYSLQALELKKKQVILDQDRNEMIPLN